MPTKGAEKKMNRPSEPKNAAETSATSKRAASSSRVTDHTWFDGTVDRKLVEEYFDLQKRKVG